jgi:hypothetical protein
MNARIIALGMLAAAAPGALAQEFVTDPNHPFAWSENVGWSWWGDNGPSGLQIFGGYCAGWIWFENIGWVTFGDGTPGNNGKYANQNGLDFGVNLAGNGNLSGFAWGENVGWINLSGGALADPPDRARFDEANLRLRGWAWGENIGWLNLDDAQDYVGLIGLNECYADCDQNEVLDLFDFLCFQNAFVAEEDYADCDTNSVFDLFDFLCYQNAFVAGCP